MRFDVTTWYLEMLAPEQLRAAFSDNPQLSVIRSEIPSPEFSRFLYTSVGGNWYWIDRLKYTYKDWLDYLNRKEVQTWVAYISGTPAGYIELELQLDASVLIVYFGVMPQFIGQRIGGHLLSVGVQQAWLMGAQRVFVHTCSLDGQYAKANYQARGFQVYREETHTIDLPEQAPGPWLGAYP